MLLTLYFKEIFSKILIISLNFAILNVLFIYNFLILIRLFKESQNFNFNNFFSNY